MQENAEISEHLFKVFALFRDNPDRWFSNLQAAPLVEGVTPRTVRAHTKRLVDLGILDQAEVFPGHRYRLSPAAKQRNGGFLARLQAAEEIFNFS